MQAMLVLHLRVVPKGNRQERALAWRRLAAGWSSVEVLTYVGGESLVDGFQGGRQLYRRAEQLCVKRVFLRV